MSKRNRDPIDELGDLRAAIRFLKEQENQLRTQIISEGISKRSASRYRVEVEEKTSRRFDRSKLPDTIANDPIYWKNVSTKYVRVFPVEQEIGAGGTRGRTKAEEDDFDVFE